MNAFKFFVGLSITFFLCKSRQGKINELILIKWRAAYLNSWVSDVLTSVNTRHCGVVWCGVVCWWYSHCQNYGSRWRTRVRITTVMSQMFKM